MLPSRIQKGRRPVRPSLPPSPIPARQARLDSVLPNSEDAIVRFFVAPGEARATGAARLSRRPIPPAVCNEGQPTRLALQLHAPDSAGKLYSNLTYSC